MGPGRGPCSVGRLHTTILLSVSALFLAAETQEA